MWHHLQLTHSAERTVQISCVCLHVGEAHSFPEGQTWKHSSSNRFNSWPRDRLMLDISTGSNMRSIQWNGSVEFKERRRRVQTCCVWPDFRLENRHFSSLTRTSPPDPPVETVLTLLSAGWTTYVTSSSVSSEQANLASLASRFRCRRHSDLHREDDFRPFPVRELRQLPLAFSANRRWVCAETSRTLTQSPQNQVDPNIQVLLLLSHWILGES